MGETRSTGSDDRVDPNGSVFDWDEFDSVARRFETVARLHPAHTALRSGDWSCTYAELNARANALAHAVIDITGGEEALVALLIGDATTTVEAAVGTLKAGAGYLVIDPSFPVDRIRRILDDAQPSAIATQAQLGELTAQVAAGFQVLVVDDFAETGSLENPDLSIDPRRLAAVYYTSGSTGEPKGIEWDQRFLLHAAWSLEGALGLSHHDRFTLILPLTFAASAMDLFGALLNGCTICQLDVGQAGLGTLRRWLKDEEISVFHPVVSLFRTFVNNLDAPLRLPELRWIIVGGDALFQDDVDRYFSYVESDAALVSQLAQSEAGVLARFLIRSPADCITKVVPVGFSTPGKEIWAVDETGRRLDDGEIGELVVASAYLARGFRHRPELTDQRFREHEGDRRVFATGDIGRLRADGFVERLGRKDRQVKIRGHRVETEEVESALRAQPAIQDSAVIVVENSQHEKRLAAFLVCSEGAQPGVAGIRKAAAATLPAYMLPSTFTVLDSLPLLGSGKVDYVALGHLEIDEGLKSEGHTAPSNSMEVQLTQIWERAFDRTQIGVSDDFFELGGDSLLALEMFHNMERQIGTALPVTVLFEAPTIEKLARLMRQNEEGEPQSTVIPVQPLGTNPALFLVPPAGRTVIVFSDLARRLGSDQPIFGHEPLGLDGTSAPDRSVERMASRYLSDLKSIQPQGPYYLGGMCFGVAVAYEMAAQLEHGGETVAMLALLDPEKVPGQGSRPTVDGQLPPRLRRPLRYPRRVLHYLGRVPYHWRKGELLAAMRRLLTRTARRVYRRFGGPKSEVKKRAENVWRVHQRASDLYKPKRYSGPLHLFCTADHRPFANHLAGWSELTGKRPNLHVIPGEHNRADSFMKEPHVQVLAAMLAACLDEAAKAHRGRSAVETPR